MKKLAVVLGVVMSSLAAMNAQARSECRAVARWNDRGRPQRVSTWGYGETHDQACTQALRACYQRKPSGLGTCSIANK